MKKFTAGVAAMLCAAPALAANWQFVASSTDGSVYSIDSDSVRRMGNAVSVWVQADLSKVKGEKLRSSKQLWKFDCANSSFNILSFIGYLPDGSVGDTRNEPDTMYAYKPVAPDTIGEAVMRKVCVS